MRLRLLHQLVKGPLSVNEWIGATRLKQANVSKHLGILHSADLVGANRQGNRVICSVIGTQVVAILALVRARRTPTAFGRQHCGQVVEVGTFGVLRGT